MSFSVKELINNGTFLLSYLSIRFVSVRRMQCNLRKNALQTCEEWIAFFARLEMTLLLSDFQVFMS